MSVDPSYWNRDNFLRWLGRHLRKQEGWWDSHEWDAVCADITTELESGKFSEMDEVAFEAETLRAEAGLLKSEVERLRAEYSLLNEQLELCRGENALLRAGFDANWAASALRANRFQRLFRAANADKRSWRQQASDRLDDALMWGRERDAAVARADAAEKRLELAEGLLRKLSFGARTDRYSVHKYDLSTDERVLLRGVRGE